MNYSVEKILARPRPGRIQYLGRWIRQVPTGVHGQRPFVSSPGAVIFCKIFYNDVLRKKANQYFVYLSLYNLWRFYTAMGDETGIRSNLTNPLIQCATVRHFFR